MAFFLIFGIFFVLVHVCHTVDVCYVNNKVLTCDYGCCNNSCCGLPTMAIIGIVIGGGMAFIGIVGCIVCLACMCKHANTTRTTSPVHPMHNTNSVFVNQTPYHRTPNQLSSFNNQPPPPSYNQYNSYPASSFGDSAFPPGTPHPPPTYYK
ncbi:hypothetical protein ACF0H5_014745 [Mactra antiquata]